MTYEIFIYELWGNLEEGFEVNDIFNTGDTIILNPEDSDKEVISSIREIYPWLLPSDTEMGITIEGENEYTLYFYEEDSHTPLFELRNKEM